MMFDFLVENSRCLNEMLVTIDSMNSLNTNLACETEASIEPLGKS